MPKNKIKKITVVGDGGWGTTLAILLAKKSFSVTIWGAFPQYIDEMQKSRFNTKFLPGIRIPSEVRFEKNLKIALASPLLIFAVPSHFAKSVLKRMKQTGVDFSTKIILSVTKGLDFKSLKRISELVEKELHPRHLAVLSGPTIALEVAQGILLL